MNCLQDFYSPEQGTKIRIRLGERLSLSSVRWEESDPEEGGTGRTGYEVSQERAMWNLRIWK